MGNESAMIIPIPEAEPIVGGLRWQYDRAARLGVPAHVTLLYPFRPPHVLDGELGTLREVFALIKAFPFSFTEIRRFPTTAYLHPDQAESFVHVTSLLVRKWPECVPYGGVHRAIIPHVTVADGVDAATLDAVEVSLRGQLPIPCVARQV
jgi:hypothetical protein